MVPQFVCMPTFLVNVFKLYLSECNVCRSTVLPEFGQLGTIPAAARPQAIAYTYLGNNEALGPHAAGALGEASGKHRR